MIRIDRRTTIDGGLLLAIPAILLLIHAVIPTSVAEDFYFYPLAPTPVTAWTAALFHSSWKHVLANSIAFLLTVAFIYVIFQRWGRRYTMWRVIGLILITTPFVTGFGNIVVFQYLITDVPLGLNVKGFSGVTSALLGMLWAAVTLYANRVTNSWIGYRSTFIAYLAGALYLILVWNVSLLTSPFVLGVFAVGFVTAGMDIYSEHSIEDTLTLSTITDIITDAEYGFLIYTWSFGFVLFIGYYPPSISAGGQTVNIVSHAIGLAYGFMISFVSLEIYDSNLSIVDSVE